MNHPDLKQSNSNPSSDPHHLDPSARKPFGVQILPLLGWIGFVSYAFLLAPPDDPEATAELIRRLISGELAGINPLIVAEFNLMGVLPLIYLSLLLIDGQRQKRLGMKIPAWPFAGLMMGVGAFALLPYLALRRPLSGSESLPALNGVLKIWNSVWTGRLLLIVTLGLLGYGLIEGNWTNFWIQWQSSRFIHVMTLDFVVLTAILPYLINADQIGRTPFQLPQWTINLIPLLGPLVYLSFRPQAMDPALELNNPG